MSSNVRTPQKASRAKNDIGRLIATPTSYGEENVNTPRPEHPPFTTIRFRPPFTAAAAHDDASHSPSVSSNPTKQMEERQYGKYPIKHLAVTNLESVNTEIREAVKRIKKIGRAKGVLSPRYAAEWARHLSAGDDDLAKDIFDGGDDRYGVAPGMDRMQRIVERAAGNIKLSAAEAAWNSGVHDFLLEEALVGSSVGKDLTWENITTASIMPDLVPEKDEGERADSKKVDFCIALELHNYKNLGQRLYQMGIRHLSQTEYCSVRYRPIAISIETKLTGEGGATALVQLSTWATAQISYLRQLLQWASNTDENSADSAIPPLPLVLIQGHTWSMYFLEHHSGGNGATLWSCGQFGTTETLLGAYQVIAAMQVLMCWATEVYQPWFERKILQPRGFKNLLIN